MRSEYWDDPEAKAAFQSFIMEMFALDFSEWDRRGYWDTAYTPFSFWDEGRVVASVCIYMLDAVIDGEKTRLAQISGVATLPEYRRKGLCAQLTAAGLEWAKGRGHRGVFLFSTEEAIPFYRASGMKEIDEYLEYVEARPRARRGSMIKLNPAEGADLEKICRYARQRAPLSERFSVLNHRLVMFHALHSLRDHIYEIPDLESLLFFKRDNGCLQIFDVVGAQVPALDEFYPYIADESDRTIEFHFHADQMGLSPDQMELSSDQEGPGSGQMGPGRISRKRLAGNNPFVDIDFPLEGPVFPFTARA